MNIYTIDRIQIEHSINYYNEKPYKITVLDYSDGSEDTHDYTIIPKNKYKYNLIHGSRNINEHNTNDRYLIKLSANGYAQEDDKIILQSLEDYTEYKNND